MESASSLSYISIFSGIEAATMAWSPLGFDAIAFSENAKFPSAVLAHHYPDIPNLGDMTKVQWEQYKGKADIVIGGPPCQAFSIAGLRESLSDHRGNLSLQYVKAIHSIEPVWAITENVPGWLSTKDNAFGCFLGGIIGADAPLDIGRKKWPGAGMADGPLGKVAWRILDAQRFGLAQRRKRVFVVASFRDWADPAKILFERKSVPGHTSPGNSSPKNDPRNTSPGFDASRRGDGVTGFGVSSDISRCILAREGNRQDYETTTLVAAPLAAPAKGHRQDLDNETYIPLDYGVRRLTPVECERLQGFPDDFTRIPWRGKPADHCPDGSRYHGVGNSMAVNVIHWIGQRILLSHQL